MLLAEGRSAERDESWGGTLYLSWVLLLLAGRGVDLLGEVGVAAVALEAANEFAKSWDLASAVSRAARR